MNTRRRNLKPSGRRQPRGPRPATRRRQRVPIINWQADTLLLPIRFLARGARGALTSLTPRPAFVFGQF